MMDCIRCKICHLTPCSILHLLRNKRVINLVVTLLPNNLRFYKSLKIAPFEVDDIVRHCRENNSFIIHKTLLFWDLKRWLLHQDSHWLEVIHQLLSESNDGLCFVRILPCNLGPVKKNRLLWFLVQEYHNFILEIEVHWNVIRRHFPFKQSFDGQQLRLFSFDLLKQIKMPTINLRDFHSLKHLIQCLLIALS